MPATTPVYALPYQTLTDPPNGADLGRLLALAVEQELARIDAAAAATPITTAWTDWAVVWTASVTNPILGNGVISGRYKQTGKLMRYWWNIAIGSTTNPGSGSYFFSFPLGVTCKATANGASSITGGFRDNSGAVQTMGFSLLIDGASSADMRSVAGNQVSSSQPYPWAAADFLRGWGWIEIP